MTSNAQIIITTPVCNLLIEASDKGIRKISKVRSNTKVPRRTTNQCQTKILTQARSALKAFFAGSTSALESLPLDIEGTEFQKKTWKALRKIPSGEVCSYSKIAKQIGKSKAARAVGTACGKNPILLAIPCHRVIAADGSLGGFTGGLPLKRALLKFENPQ